MLQPNAVDENACDERVVAAGEPLCKREASPARGEIGTLLPQFDALTGRREDTESPGDNGFLRLLWIAPMKNMRHRHFAGWLRQDSDEILWRFARAHLRDLCVHRLQVIRSLLIVLVEDTRVDVD